MLEDFLNEIDKVLSGSIDSVVLGKQLYLYEIDTYLEHVGIVSDTFLSQGNDGYYYKIYKRGDEIFKAYGGGSIKEGLIFKRL